MIEKNKILPNYGIMPASTVEKEFVLRRLECNFGFSKMNPDYIIHKAFSLYRKAKRIRTASTKTKSEVSGGGRKPWPQKGRGKARAGSIRSPLWRGGGVCFGPKPKNSWIKLNNQEYDQAFRTLLFEKQKNIIPIRLVEDPASNIAYTKSVLQTINRVLYQNSITNENLIGNKTLTIIVSSEEYKFLQQSMFFNGIKNIPKVKLIKDTELNINDLIRSNYVLITAFSFYNLTTKDLNWKKIKN